MESSASAKTRSVVFLMFKKGKRPCLLTDALDTGSAFANAHLSGMTMLLLEDKGPPTPPA